METAHCVPILVAVRYALPYTDRAFTCSRLRYTRSVGITPLLFGCSAPQRVQRYVTGAAPHNGCSPPQQAHGHTALQRDSAQSSANRHTALQREQWPQRSATHHHNRHNTSSSTPDPSALHPFCSGAAPHNGCSAPQRVQRHATDAFRATCAPRDGEYATMTTPKHSMSGAGAIASDLSISPGILSTGTRPTGDRGIVTAAALASCPPARDQPMLLRAAVAAFKTGVAVSQPSERYETVRHDAIASSCRSFLHVANAEEPTATATAETIAPLEAWDAHAAARHHSHQN